MKVTKKLSDTRTEFNMRKIPVIVKIDNEEKWFNSINAAALAIGCSCTTISNIYYRSNYLHNRYGIQKIWMSNEKKEKIEFDI